MAPKATTKSLTTGQEDGGHYAIKGFLYQFDKTLLEILDNPNTVVRFENQQDINYQDFVLQVKHRGAQKYAPSKIRKAVEQLLAFFQQDSTKKISLYCHFQDKSPQDWFPTLAEIDSIISVKAKGAYQDSLRKNFTDNFRIRFSEDYDTQFENTIKSIRVTFTLPDNETAALYHAIFRSKLLTLCVGPKSRRKIRLKDLRGSLSDAEVRVFEVAYSKYLGNKKYVQLIRKTYFTPANPNIENYERLFIVDCDSAINLTKLVRIAARLASKFYKKAKSSQPYVIFRNYPDGKLKRLKQALLDHRIHFLDGTHFDGDRFRLDDLTTVPVTTRDFTLKVVTEHHTRTIVRTVQMKEVFQFFVDEPMQLKISGEHRRIQIKKTEQVLQMIE